MPGRRWWSGALESPVRALIDAFLRQYCSNEHAGTRCATCRTLTFCARLCVPTVVFEELPPPPRPPGLSASVKVHHLGTVNLETDLLYCPYIGAEYPTSMVPFRAPASFAKIAHAPIGLLGMIRTYPSLLQWSCICSHRHSCVSLCAVAGGSRSGSYYSRHHVMLCLLASQSLDLWSPTGTLDITHPPRGEHHRATVTTTQPALYGHFTVCHHRAAAQWVQLLAHPISKLGLPCLRAACPRHRAHR